MESSSKKGRNNPPKIKFLKSQKISSENETFSTDNIKVKDIFDDNLLTLNKIHAILLNCSNLSKKQKLEFCESERYFMKLYLKKLKKQNEVI
jgi:hypothetical protein